MTFSTLFKPASAFALAAILVVTPLASADESNERGEKRRGPPQEAFDACAGSTEGSTCGFSGRRGDMQGTCITPPRGEQVLVCAPERGQRGQRGSRDRDEIQ